MAEQTSVTMKLWTPSGVEVLVAAQPGQNEEHFAKILQEIEPVAAAAAQAGWILQPIAPGGGEQKSLIGYIVRKTHTDSRDNSETPRLILYDANEHYKYPFLSVYLNNDDDITAFERASGLRLNDLPLYIGGDNPERGKNRQVDQFIFRVSRPFEVVWKPNPRYDVEAARVAAAKQEAYTVPRRIFVRWGGQKAASGRPSRSDRTTSAPSGQRTDPRDQPQGQTPQQFHQWWMGFLHNKPPVDVLNRNLSKLADGPTPAAKSAAWSEIKKYAQSCYWMYNEQLKQFYVPPSQDPYQDDSNIPF